MEPSDLKQPEKLPLNTPRLVLRPLCLHDAEALYRLHHEPGVWKFFTGQPPATLEEERSKIEQHLRAYEGLKLGIRTVVLRETGEIIGRCGLLRRELEGAVEVELMYMLSPRFWGQGLASEAARAVRDYAMQSLRLTRLVSLIAPENVASKRVANATGMRMERPTQFDERAVEVFAIERAVTA